MKVRLICATNFDLVRDVYNMNYTKYKTCIVDIPDDIVAEQYNIVGCEVVEDKED